MSRTLSISLLGLLMLLLAGGVALAQPVGDPHFAASTEGRAPAGLLLVDPAQGTATPTATPCCQLDDGVPHIVTCTVDSGTGLITIGFFYGLHNPCALPITVRITEELEVSVDGANWTLQAQQVITSATILPQWYVDFQRDFRNQNIPAADQFYRVRVTAADFNGCFSLVHTTSAMPICRAGATATPTSSATGTPAVSATTTPPTTATRPPAPPTVTPCAIQFTDVDQNNPFYAFIRCLACRQIVSGYADGTFRWGNEVTRGQLSKIIAGAAGLSATIPSTQQTFADVPNNNTFWLFIERLAGIGAISGYGCGSPGEPCDPLNRSYFHWNWNATRGQISKITAVTAGWNGPIPTTQQTFTDVPPNHAFWLWIEELATRGIISGYACGGPGEPCDPQSRPYFRWGNNATRGQMSKIAASAFFPNCQTPAKTRNEE